MVVGCCEIKLLAEWVNSLKAKRTVVKSVIEKIKNKFNVSVAEIKEQDNHKIIVIGFCCATTSSAHADSILDNVLNFVENNTDAVIFDITREIIQNT